MEFEEINAEDLGPSLNSIFTAQAGQDRIKDLENQLAEKDNFIYTAEPFINKSMATIYTEIEQQTENEVIKAIYKIAVDVDKDKLKQWLERATMLDTIDKNELIGIATRKKFMQKDEKIEQLKYQLAEKEQEVRHQVCDLIREYCKNNFEPIANKLGCFVSINREDFFDKLDQIEGENK